MYKTPNKFKVLTSVFAAVLLIVLFGAGIFALEKNLSKKTSQEAEEQLETQTTLYVGDYELDMTHNIESYLFLGTDDSGNEAAVGTKDYHGAMADFILLLVLDKTDNKYGYLQVDRNTIAEVPYMDWEGNGEDTMEEQICTAHWYGANPDQGCDNTVWTLSELLGELPIDGYYSIHMSDVGTLNHAVGGVQVTLDEDFSKDDPEMTKGKTLVLTDEQAEIYVRGRSEFADDSNAARMKRQQQFMSDFKSKLMKKSKEDPEFLNDLFGELKNDAVTDIPQNRISVIANQIYKSEDLGTLQLQGKTKLGHKLKDGKEHEEFYPTEESIVDVLCRLCGIDAEHVTKYEEEDLEDEE